MISKALLNKFILKYAFEDVNDVDAKSTKWTKEWYEACMADPDCYSKMRLEDNKRYNAYHERQRENPSEAFLARQKAKADALKALRESGSLHGIAKSMSNSLATYKSELRKAVIRKMKTGTDTAEIAKHPLVKQWAPDSSEFYYLRDKIKELAEYIEIVEADKPLQLEDKQQLMNTINLCNSYLEKFKGKYPSILKHIVNAITKMNALAVV